MNLGEFIKFREVCPLCNSNLTTKLTGSSGRKQTSKLEDGRFVSVFTMKPMRNSQPDYKVGYSFGLEDNSLCVEFYTEWNHYKQVPMHLIKKFKEFHQNAIVGSYIFLRECHSCSRYKNSSSPFLLENILPPTLRDLSFSEIFMFVLPAQDNQKVIFLSNHDDSSDLFWWRVDNEEIVRVGKTIPTNHGEIYDLPLIPFLSREETAERLNNLIIFA